MFKGTLTKEATLMEASHSTTSQYIGLTDHVTSNFNNNLSTDAVLLDIGKTINKTYHSGLVYKLPNLKF
jgi:hypothetical protein